MHITMMKTLSPLLQFAWPEFPATLGLRHYSDHIYILTRGLKRSAFLKAEAFYISRANRVLVPVESDARFLIHQQRVPREKVVVLPFGFDFGRASISSPEAPERLRRSYGLEGKYVALTCCRLSREKGLDYLIPIISEVRARHQDFRLVMVGSGSLEEKLRREIAELGIGDVVQMVGWRDDAIDWIAAADLVIQPSRGESFCQVLLEALALKKPVVMTPVGAGPEIIGQNERGGSSPSVILTCADDFHLRVGLRPYARSEVGRTRICLHQGTF